MTNFKSKRMREKHRESNNHGNSRLLIINALTNSLAEVIIDAEDAA